MVGRLANNKLLSYATKKYHAILASIASTSLASTTSAQAIDNYYSALPSNKERCPMLPALTFTALGLTDSVLALDIDSLLLSLPSKPKTSLLSIPQELQIEIFTQGDLVSATCLGLTNKHFYETLKEVYAKEFPIELHTGREDQRDRKLWMLLEVSQRSISCQESLFRQEHHVG